MSPFKKKDSNQDEEVNGQVAPKDHLPTYITCGQLDL